MTDNNTKSIKDSENSANSGKKVIFSGIQPSGALTIGNYIGALKNFVAMQREYDCYYCIVNMHSITVDITAAELRKNSYDLLALYIACGLDTDSNTVFLQSHVPAHAELAWVLNCHTMFGEARRMTQFKDKSSRNPDNINVGLFSYPVLMAADILLYQTDVVPIGVDQKQHLELARDLAERFNNRFSPTFKVPEGYIPNKEGGAKIMDLLQPDKKMSKSLPNGAVLMLDSPDVIRAKFRRAVTDSGSGVVYSKDKAGVSNMLTIYSAFAGESIAAAERRFEGVGYGDFKMAAADAVIEGLRAVREEYARLIADKGYLDSVLNKGREKANYTARKTLAKVYRKVGFLD